MCLSLFSVRPHDVPATCDPHSDAEGLWNPESLARVCGWVLNRSPICQTQDSRLCWVPASCSHYNVAERSSANIRLTFQCLNCFSQRKSSRTSGALFSSPKTQIVMLLVNLRLVSPNLEESYNDRHIKRELLWPDSLSDQNPFGTAQSQNYEFNAFKLLPPS